MAVDKGDRQQTHEDPIRLTTFVNADAEAAPPFALLEVAGYDADTQSFTVTRPTRNNANDLLVNGPVAIGPGEEGQAFIGHWLPMVWQDDGGQKVYDGQEETTPDYGDTLGSVAGEWYPSRRAAGYFVTAKFGAEGDKTVLVRAQNYNLVEYVEITACWEEGDEAPPSYSAARMVYFDPVRDLWVYPPADIEVWYRDLSGVGIGLTDPTSGGGPCRVRAMLTGTGFGLPVYLGEALHRCDPCASGTTTTTTTPPPTSTTTPEPCTGGCEWSWDGATGEYTYVTSDCSTGCDCLPPNFIPPTNAACPTVTVRTECGRTGGTSAWPPNCSTTTAGPTTTGPPGCVGCKWAWTFPGWVRIETEEYNCDSCVGCAYPSAVPGDAAAECEPTFTPCSPPPPPPPPPYCVGDCRWVGAYDNATWMLKNYNCASFGIDSGYCTCDQPAHTPECGEFALTPCYVHDPMGTTTVGPPPPSSLCSTTLPPFGSCNGGCVYQWWVPPAVSVAQWVKTFHGCPGCACHHPDEDGEECDTVQVACEQQTTTVPPTSTTPPPTTTPPPGECGCCYEEHWRYQGPYDLDPSMSVWIFEGGVYLGGECVYTPGPGGCGYEECSAAYWEAVGGGGGSWIGVGNPPSGTIPGFSASCGEWANEGPDLWKRTCCIICTGAPECCTGPTTTTPPPTTTPCPTACPGTCTYQWWPAGSAWFMVLDCFGTGCACPPPPPPWTSGDQVVYIPCEVDCDPLTTTTATVPPAAATNHPGPGHHRHRRAD